MSPLSPMQVEELALQRRKARRAMAIGRRWYLRGTLMVVIAGVALYRGGQLNTVLGAALIVMSLLSISLGRSMRRGANETERKISLMETT